MRIEYTIQELVKIIQTDKRENQITACVPPVKRLPHLYSTLSAFANQADGGYILFGIKNSGAYDVKGIHEEDKLFIIEELRNQCQKMYPEPLPTFDEAVINGKRILRAHISHTDEPCYFKLSTSQDSLYYRYQNQNCRVFPFSQKVNRMGELSSASDKSVTTNIERVALHDFHTFYTNYCEKYNCWNRDVISVLCQSGILFPREEQEYKLTLTDEGELLFYNQAQACLIEIKEPLPNEFDQLFQEMQDFPFTREKLSKYDVDKLFSPATSFWQQTLIQEKIQKILSEYDEYFKKNELALLQGTLSRTIAEIESTLFSLPHHDKFDRNAIREALCNAFLHQDLKKKCPIDVIYSSECNWILIRNAGGLITPCSEKVLGRFPVGIRNLILKNAYSLITGTESFNQGISNMQHAMAKRNYHAPIFIDARECFFTILLFTPKHNTETQESTSDQQKSCDKLLEYSLKEERAELDSPFYPWFGIKPLDSDTVEKNIKEIQSNLSDFLWKANSSLKIGNQARLCKEFQDFCKEHNIPNPLLSK